MNNNSRHFGHAANAPLNASHSWGKIPVGADYGTTEMELRLDSPGTSGLYSFALKGTKRKWGNMNGFQSLVPASLALGLGRSSSSSDTSKMSATTVCTMSSVKDTTDDESSIDLGLNFELHLGNDSAFSSKNPFASAIKSLETGPNLDLELSLSTGRSESVITSSTPVSTQQYDFLKTSSIRRSVPIIGEEGGSVSSHLNFANGHLLSLSEATSVFPLKQKIPAKADLFPVISYLTSTIEQTPKRAAACSSGITHQQQRNSSTKNCQFPGCVKGARGASGLCIAHGGGRRCQKDGCHKGAEGRTVYCKSHGGGRRCESLGCTKSAEGRTDYCIAHGGGRRCNHENCTRAARGKSGLCIRHGGGKRCQMENCKKSAEGYSGLCISHGGGRRCQFPECRKGAQGSTMFCKAHGGGKRCTVLGCTKGAEGSTSFCKGHGGGKRCSFQDGGVCSKSVHGGTLFCVAHGGGKRCAVAECTKSARGRTDFCVRHGGGKRCKSEGCGKSAQGSTDFCKAHGGGKRCSWGQSGSDFGAGGTPCDRFARGKTGLCAAHSALVQDRCVHGGGTLAHTMTKFPAAIKHEMVVEAAAAERDELSKMADGVDSFAGWGGLDAMESMQPSTPFHSESVSIPEGRVHGGSIMALLSGSVASEN